ncbi:hypothetical protein GCK72_022902 [Caenorhabditis remanei]|uniref:Serpentine receptor class gamma n=1 Tax=Caenorhabditis remanei TaxID=31234 RepID=A0A6A5FV99_CAERE|nr:hypothetical protein GCK72_022902 [Caenorhabditis remanei]KAF1746446.1 hypothetical protein GCK72_022902 [Caenorhabditis remanei]
MLLFCLGKKYKKNSFYRLVQLDLGTNIACHINTWIAIRFQMYPGLVFIVKFIETTIPGLLKWLKFFCIWFFHVHFWTAELLALHRMSSILFPYSYQTFWNRFYLRIFIVIWVVSGLPKFLWTGFISEVYIVDGKLMSIVFPTTRRTAGDVAAIFSIIYIALLIATGVVNYILLCRLPYVDITSKASIKRMLRNTATVYALAYIGEVVWSVLNAADSHFHIFSPWFIEHNTCLLLIVSTIFTLSLPYILLAFDKNVREDVWGRCKKRVAQIRGAPDVVSRSILI